MSDRVLITGGAGFIGLHLGAKLVSSGYEVCIADNFSRGIHDQQLEEFLSNPRSSCRHVDLLNDTEVAGLGEEFNYIFHLAAIIGVKNVLAQPYSVLVQNARMLDSIIGLARQQKRLHRFLFASTSEVYAGTLRYFDLIIPTPEEVPLALTPLTEPRTTYMLSKIYGEAMCQQSGLPFTVFRPHNIYGPRMGMAHVIPEQLRKIWLARPGGKIDVFSIDHTRAFCYISDAVEMLQEIMTKEVCCEKTLNLGVTNPEVSMRELVEICLEVVGAKNEIYAGDPTPGSPKRRAPDMTWTYGHLESRPRVTLREGVRLTWDWYMANIFSGREETAK